MCAGALAFGQPPRAAAVVSDVPQYAIAAPEYLAARDAPPTHG